MASKASGSNSSSSKIEKLLAQLAKDPRSKDFIPLAEEYVNAGLLQEAALTLEDGLKVYPTFVTALVKLGGVYVQLQENAKAQNRLEEAIMHSPENMLAHRMLARLYLQNNNPEWAKRSCEKVLFESPTDKEMLDLQKEIEKHPISLTPQPAETGELIPSLQNQEQETALNHQDADPTTKEGVPGPETEPPTEPANQINQLTALLERVRARRAS